MRGGAGVGAGPGSGGEPCARVHQGGSRSGSALRQGLGCSGGDVGEAGVGLAPDVGEAAGGGVGVEPQQAPGLPQGSVVGAECVAVDGPRQVGVGDGRGGGAAQDFAAGFELVEHRGPQRGSAVQQVASHAAGP